MAQGSRTPAAQEQEFRKHYLVTGNASASARAVGLSIHTGTALAKRAVKDARFTKAREEMRARLLPDAECMLRTSLEIAHERLNEDPPKPKELFALAASYGLKSASYQDPRPAYFKGIIDAVKVIGGLERLAAERRGEITPSEVVINISPTPEAAERLRGEAELDGPVSG